MAFDNIILVDLVDTLVDNMRATGSITGSTEVAGRYTILSTNTFKDRESIEINSIKYVVYSPTTTQFEIEAETGLDFTGETWKALFPYYMHDHPVLMNRRLKKMNKGDWMNRKYPAILLLQDFAQDSEVEDTAIYANATPTIVIVNYTEIKTDTEGRYAYNFRPILYPLYYELLIQFSKSGDFNTKGSKAFNHRLIESPYYGETAENGNLANKFDDPLDALVLSSTAIKINDNRCNFLNK